MKTVSYSREQGKLIDAILNDVHRLARETSELSCKAVVTVWKRDPKSMGQLSTICANARGLLECAEAIEKIVNGGAT